VFRTVIPLNTKIGEAPIAMVPLSNYAPGSAGEVAYDHLTTEVEGRYAWR
nr:ParA family protein [Ktedonobacteraceae bacterium]